MIKKIFNSILSLGAGALILFGTSLPSQAQVLFSEDFESGNFSKWGMVWEENRWTIVSDPANSGSKVARVYYARSSANHADDNQMIIARPLGTKHLFTRAYLYLPADLDLDGTKNSNINRKLFYWKSENYGNGDNWYCLIDIDSSLNLKFASRYTGSISNTLWHIAKLPGLGRWICLEVEIDATRPAGSQVFRLWIDGNLAYSRTDLNLSGNLPDNLGQVEIGRQVDLSDNSTFEYRYWDDVVLSTTYVGPKSGAGTPPPVPEPTPQISKPAITLIQ